LRDGYAKFFHTLLDCGVYFPPSQYESCFISSMHDGIDLEVTQRAVAQALRGKA
jgi:glutamate-1-semialdehyde 2,1-aminomutase